MASSSTSGSSLCTICFEPVLDHNSRGRAQLICGHCFHLDCIGTEFNYKRAMVCPNCRVTEYGDWGCGSPSPYYEEVDLNMTPLFDYDLYEVYTVDDTSAVYRELHEAVQRSLGNQLPMVDPVIHYHQNAVVSPPPGSLHDVPIHTDALLGASGISAYNARMERVIERVVLHEPERSYTAQIRSSYDSPSHGPYDPPTLEVQAMFDRSIRNHDLGETSLPTDEASELSSANTDLTLALVPSTRSSDDPTGDADRMGDR